MAVIIRLRRDGAKNSPYYRIVVADKHSPRDGKFLELIGTYDPKKKGDNSTIKLERAAAMVFHIFQQGVPRVEFPVEMRHRFPGHDRHFVDPAANGGTSRNQTRIAGFA